MATVSPSRLIPLVRKKKRPSCVLLPGLGGGLEPYLRLAAALGEQRNVHAFRAAGLMPEELPETSVAEMGDAAAAVLEQSGIQPELVIGWSLGGVVGWELCTRLPHRPPLVIIDSAPCPWQASEDSRVELRSSITGMLGPNPDPGTRDRVLSTVDAQLDALAEHKTSVGYDGPVLLLMCQPDEGWREEAVRGWRALAPNLRTARLGAGHYEVFDAGRLPELIDQIAEFEEAW
ncbi:hypothetical protein GCM10010174_18310 [Kutzneria viridogrisea]|uniref:Thioesterase domain-containing protein n=1 Tax=Kutzneria viridogrisea TaxID=47990 RepID=A0ABR6B7Y6_9PSEU|nr:thioesterase domain-containing protein [Kutzneria viridogrisea]